MSALTDTLAALNAADTAVQAGLATVQEALTNLQAQVATLQSAWADQAGLDALAQVVKDFQSAAEALTTAAPLDSGAPPEVDSGAPPDA